MTTPTAIEAGLFANAVIEVDPDGGPEDVDLQVAEIEFLSSGDPEARMGPVYRVWVKNDGATPLRTEVEIVLVATDATTPTKDSPFVTGRLAQLPAGERAAVDVRLPIEVMEMSVDFEGNPVPFKNLFAAVDAHGKQAESDESNNALGIRRDKIPTTLALLD